MIMIGLQDANDFTTTVLLENVTYKLGFCWNSRMARWNMDLMRQDGTEILRGVAVVPGVPLISGYTRLLNSTDIRGEFIVVAANQASQSAQEVGRSDFTAGLFSFLYVSKEELDAILEASLPD